MPEDATSPQPQPRRDARGRFVQGASGNPAGRRPGTPNQATRLAATMLGARVADLRTPILRVGAGDADPIYRSWVFQPGSLLFNHDENATCIRPAFAGAR